jgi:argininosuccinate lyase
MENDAVLAQMTEEQKMVALWEKRIELFGEDAREIWVDEMMATDSRKAKMLDTLEFINGSTDTSIGEKLQLYQESLEDTYKGTPEAYFLDQKPILAKIFFSIDSVQNELKQMRPEDRQMEINKIRREMGFTEEMVKEMEKVDADNNQRWDVGLKYMEERKSVVDRFDGEEEKTQLQALREKYFRDEAQTIQLEEENDGFFRFERPRYYGRN